MMRPLDELLSIAAEVMRDVQADHALIGGCARNAYAPERATRDVDLVVLADESLYRRIKDALEQRGFTAATIVKDDPIDALPNLVLFRDVTGGRIDILFARTPFERSALARRVATTVAGLTIAVVTVEDLIVYKLAAGRSQDLVDAEDVARTQAIGGRTIDWNYVERWCSEWEALPRLERLRHALVSDSELP